MPYNRLPNVGPNHPAASNDEAEAQRNKVRTDLNILIAAIQKSQNEYDDDIETFRTAIPHISTESPIVAKVAERLSELLSDEAFDDNYNEVIQDAKDLVKGI